MSSFSTVPTPEHLLELAWDFRLTRSIWLMTYALLIYDYILTFTDEVLYMWTQKWTPAKLLFLLTRYWTILSLLPSVVVISIDHDSPLACKFSYAWFVYSELVTQTLGSVILVLRIYAMYDKNKTLLYCLVGFLAAVLLVQIIFSAILSKETGHGLNKTIHASGCIPNNWRYKPWVYWVPATTFDGFLFLLAIAKSIDCAREPGANTTPRLLFTMLRDSFLYFGFVFVVIIADLVVWTRASSGLYVALPELVPVLNSIMACRMLLNMMHASRPFLAQPWKERDKAVFSEALRLMSRWKSPDLELASSTPSTQLPDSPVVEGVQRVR